MMVSECARASIENREYHYKQILHEHTLFKGCRTSAVAGCQRPPRSAGVGQASREETAGSLGSAFWFVRAMGI